MVCPVPEDQRPLNEYLALKESWFYGWAGLPAIAYYRTLGIWGIVLALLAAPVAAASFAPRRHGLAFAAVDLLAAALGIVLVWGRLWLGWNYIRQRLAAPVVPYEETGWYDGQAWEKPLVDRTREALLIASEVMPRLQRIQRTLIGAIALAGVCTLALML
ncbi:MAG: CGLD27 family protein [Oscillatoriales cyanobacterium SM2_1_8]|nr:CGLD27 family protein [Oscillatoriales cyanobacterium SM2_1_8]